MTGTTSTTPPARGRGAPEALIVGAGPTGLTLACELARRGVPFRLIEASPGPQRGSRGKGIQPHRVELLEPPHRHRTNRHRVEEMQLFAPAAAGNDQASILEYPQMLGDGLPTDPLPCRE